jgi:transposase
MDDAPVPVRIEIPERFNPSHWRLARATCLRIEAAIPKARSLSWRFWFDGWAGENVDQTWVDVAREYEPEADRRPALRCAIVRSSNPDRWRIEYDQTEVGAHLAIVAPLSVLFDRAQWDKLAIRPHTAIAAAYPQGVVLVTKGRWPTDRQQRLVMI